MSLREDYAKQYWQLGNIITGFSVVQVLATLLYFGTNTTLRKALNDFGATKLTIIVVLFHSIYALATWYCYVLERRLLPQEETQILSDQRHILIGRLVAIALFGGLLLSALLPWTIR
jgi:hypothetical protein